MREAARRRTRNPRTSNHSAPTRSNLPSFPEKTAVVGFIRPYKLMEFEKSRLVAPVIESDGKFLISVAARQRWR